MYDLNIKEARTNSVKSETSPSKATKIRITCKIFYFLNPHFMEKNLNVDFFFQVRPKNYTKKWRGSHDQQ